MKKYKCIKIQNEHDCKNTNKRKWFFSPFQQDDLPENFF